MTTNTHVHAFQDWADCNEIIDVIALVGDCFYTFNYRQNHFLPSGYRHIEIKILYFLYEFLSNNHYQNCLLI